MRLSEYFVGVASKRLSAVEASVEASNQHEFNGVARLRELLGSERGKFPARLFYLAEDDGRSLEAMADVTWYDAREAHPSRSEYRLYFPATAVSERAKEGDLLVVAKRPDDSLVIVLAENASTAERQAQWLFDLDPSKGSALTVRRIDGGVEIGAGARAILEHLGIEALDVGSVDVEAVLEEFGGRFPTTAQFSSYARAQLPHVSSPADPDAALLAWLEHEERLFRALEKCLVRERLRHGFGEDVDSFIEFSLSVQNRRKARAGRALENHLAQIFDDHRVTYSRGAATERANRPDFIFPHIRQYRDDAFPSPRLTMLGAKSTCKDRWRQVLPEADRVSEKHLLTLEPGISENQTTEMKAMKVRLVVPSALQPTYTTSQRSWLLELREFLSIVLTKQDR